MEIKFGMKLFFFNYIGLVFVNMLTILQYELKSLRYEASKMVLDFLDTV